MDRLELVHRISKVKIQIAKVSKIEVILQLLNVNYVTICNAYNRIIFVLFGLTKYILG